MIYRASKYDPGPLRATAFGFPFIGAYDLEGLAVTGSDAGGGEFGGWDCQSPLVPLAPIPVRYEDDDPMAPALPVDLGVPPLNGL